LGPVLKVSVLAGLAVGIAVLLLIAFLFLPIIPTLPMASESTVAIWKRFLASFYGGIVEELLMRLFLLSLLAWLLSKLLHQGNRSPSAVVFWTANLIVAIIFGLGHLPSASLIMPITPVVVVAALLLNGIAALVFGYLYWKRGLEAAMVAHFSADIILHVIGPAFLKT